MTNLDWRTEITCVGCDKGHTGTCSQWWSLSGYYGLNGWFCNSCYGKVEHRDGRPIHPVAYRNLKNKLNPELGVQTLKDFNLRLRRAGVPVEMVKGDGYFWFLSTDERYFEVESIYVCHFSHASPEYWGRRLAEVINQWKELTE